MIISTGKVIITKDNIVAEGFHFEDIESKDILKDGSIEAIKWALNRIVDTLVEKPEEAKLKNPCKHESHQVKRKVVMAGDLQPRQVFECECGARVEPETYKREVMGSYGQKGVEG